MRRGPTWLLTTTSPAVRCAMAAQHPVHGSLCLSALTFTRFSLGSGEVGQPAFCLRAQMPAQWQPWCAAAALAALAALRSPDTCTCFLHALSRRPADFAWSKARCWGGGATAQRALPLPTGAHRRQASSRLALFPFPCNPRPLSTKTLPFSRFTTSRVSSPPPCLSRHRDTPARTRPSPPLLPPPAAAPRSSSRRASPSSPSPTARRRG